MYGELKVFPSNKSEALALAYVQGQDLKGKTPSEVYWMYMKALQGMESLKNMRPSH